MQTRTRTTTKRTLTASAAAVLTLTSVQLSTAHGEERSTSSPPAQISADFGTSEGKLPRPERNNNFGNVTAWPEQRDDDTAYLNEKGLHGDIYRVWLSSPNAPAEHNIFNNCDLKKQVCDFSRLDAYLTEASEVSDSVLVNLNPTDFVEGKRPMKELRPMVELIIRQLKEKYPRVGHVEVFNEPDWQFHGKARHDGKPPEQTTLQPEELYRYYVPFYEAVNKVNKGLSKTKRLQVGGPSLSFIDRKWLEPFLDSYAADPAPGKRLDFLSYHSYLKWDDDYKVPTLYKQDLRQVAGDRKTVRNWLTERGINSRTPTFVTETGIYPGPAYDDPKPKNDYLRQAAAMATYSYLYAGQSDTRVFNWCVRHRVEERKDQLVTRTPDGPVKDTFTPYGNMMLMQSKMKDTRVSADSDERQGDNGVYAMASRDRTGASLMAWNWQHTKDRSYRTTVNMSDLPESLRNGPVRQRMYRIDAKTSNYFTDPAKADLQLVQEKTIEPGSSHSESIELGPNAMYLILLEPM